MKGLAILALLAGLWVYGFLTFVADVAALREPSSQEALQPADAIVVLTGGSERVATAIELLKAGQGKKLFISGVHPKFAAGEIPGWASVPPETRTCCIALGYRADSTQGNADETRDWIRTEGFTSLRLVTANYHMPRSLLLFRAAMPGIVIVPFPVEPDSVRIDRWRAHPHTAQLLANEYNKYLLALIKTKLETP